jgi:hypothetical protein
MKYILVIYLGVLLIRCSSTQPINSQRDKKFNREFSQSISRNFNNEFEEKLLNRAESIYPPRDSVLKFTPEKYKNSIPSTGYWFYDIIDSIKIPYAITSHAVDYYSKKVDELYKDSTSIIYSAKFIYKAEVNYYDTYSLKVDRIHQFIKQPYSFNNVFVVEMYLEWIHECGNLCGLSISLKRIIIFDKQGNFLRTFYDRSTSVLIV